MRRRRLRSLQSKCVRVDIIQVSRLGVFDLQDRAWVDDVAPLLHGRVPRLAFASSHLLAPLRDADGLCECPLIRVDRNSSADSQNVARDIRPDQLLSWFWCNLSLVAWFEPAIVHRCRYPHFGGY